MLIISGIMLVLKKFFHPGYDLVNANIIPNCKINKDCKCGIDEDKLKMYKGLNCVNISYPYRKGTSGTNTVPDVVVSKKYNDNSIQILVDSSKDDAIITKDDIQIYNSDNFINGLILLGVGLLFMWFAWSGLKSNKKYKSKKYIC
jgi:hypothetical protein